MLLISTNNFAFSTLLKILKIEIYKTIIQEKVKSSRPSLRKTRDKRPLSRDPDTSWCEDHTSVKLSSRSQ